MVLITVYTLPLSFQHHNVHLDTHDLQLRKSILESMHVYANNNTMIMMEMSSINAPIRPPMEPPIVGPRSM